MHLGQVRLNPVEQELQKNIVSLTGRAEVCRRARELQEKGSEGRSMLLSQLFLKGFVCNRFFFLIKLLCIKVIFFFILHLPTSSISVVLP